MDFPLSSKKKEIEERVRFFKTYEINYSSPHFLGEGCYAKVYKIEIEGEEYALKIGYCPKSDNYLEFLTFVLNHPELKHLPSVLYYQEEEDYYFVVLPIYKPFSEVEDKEEYFTTCRRIIICDKIKIEDMPIPTTLIKTMINLMTTKRVYNKDNYKNIIHNDFHIGNVMWNEELELVITDPWA